MSILNKDENAELLEKAMTLSASMENLSKSMKTEILRAVENEPNEELHPQLANRLTREQIAHLGEQAAEHLADE